MIFEKSIEQEKFYSKVRNTTQISIKQKFNKIHRKQKTNTTIQYCIVNRNK